VIWLLYNILLIVLAPIWVAWMWWRTRQRKEAPNWEERLGNYAIRPQKEDQRIWIHAVSVGEVVAATPILKELRELLPGFEIVLTTTTSSGHQTAREKLEGLYDHLFYFPIDLPRFVLGALVRVRPRVVAVMETELWFNFLTMAKNIGCHTMVINGRISDRSFQRSQGMSFFYRALFKKLDKALVQTESDASRFRAFGFEAPVVLGNCKFDQAVDGLDSDAGVWRAEIGAAPADFIVVVGSTRGEEDEAIVMEGLRAAFPSLEGVRIVYAPRHIERAEALVARGREFWGAAARRSLGESGPFLVLDTYGELAKVYAAADVVVVGGGFANMGGQNLIQPLAHGKPVLHGPHMQNFRDATTMARDAGAALSCAGAQELAAALTSLRADPMKRMMMGAQAAGLVMKNLGASRRYAEAIAAAARSPRS
jgi:3-deoxy-D-manno-octulosonic-acid transferase